MSNETISEQIYNFWVNGPFHWTLLSLCLVLVWFCYLTFWNSRLIGTILTFIIHRFTSYNVKIGSVSLSVLGGKLMIRDLYIINKDYSFRSYFVVIIFNYWKSYDPEKKNESDRSLKIHAFKPEFHMFNRSQVYKDLKNVMNNVSENRLLLTLDNIRYYTSGKTTQNRHKTLNSDYVDSRYADGNDDESKNTGWDFNYQALIPIIVLDLELFTMCFGNHLWPTTFCLKSDKTSITYSTCSSTYVVDKYKHLVKANCINFRADFVPTLNFKGNSALYSNKSKATSQILFFGNSEFILEIDEPGKVTIEPEIIQMTQGNIAVLRTFPKYSLAVEVSRKCHISYDAWVDSQRDILHKFFFPPDFQTMKVSQLPQRGSSRCHKDFEIYFKSLADTQMEIIFNDKKIQLASDNRCTVDIVIPWLVNEDGYNCTVHGIIPQTQCKFPQHLCSDFIVAEELDMLVDVHYPRVWNATQNWNININLNKAKTHLVFDYKDYITELVDDWVGDSSPDLCKFTPYIYDIKIEAKDTKYVLYANDYNWISTLDENAYLAFQTQKSLIHITMPFIDFLPDKMNYSINIEADNVKCQLSLPETSTSLYIMKEFHNHMKLVNEDCKPAINEPEMFKITTEFAKGDEQKSSEKRRLIHWIDCIQAPSVKVSINYHYHPMPVVKNLWDFTTSDLRSYAKLTKQSSLPMDEDPLNLLRPEGHCSYGPTADFLTRSHFDSSFMDPDLLILDVNVSSAVVCLYGSLLRHILHIKENYFGENRRVTDFNDKQLTSIEQAREIESKVFGKHLSDPRQFRPFSAKITVKAHNVQGHLIKHCSNDASHCPTVFIDCIGFEMDKGHAETKLQVLVSPVLILIFDKLANQRNSMPENNSGINVNNKNQGLNRGSIVLEGIQVRGHALFTDGLFEYAWMMEANLGSIKGKLTAENLNSLVHCVQSFVFLVVDQENELKPSRDFEFCQHLWPVNECPEWKFKHRHPCPREADVKYKLLRVLFDGLQLHIVEPSDPNSSASCLELEVEGPVHLVNCNLHGPTTREGISAVLPRVSVSQLIRPRQIDTNATSGISGSNIWLQAGHLQLGDLVLNAGIALPTPDSRVWQDHYLRYHDKPFKRLWFLWSDLAVNEHKELSKQCGCVGGCYYFAENHLNITYSRATLDNWDKNSQLNLNKATGFTSKDVLGKTRLLTFGESMFNRGKWVFETHNPEVCCQIKNGWILLREEKERDELIKQWACKKWGIQKDEDLYQWSTDSDSDDNMNDKNQYLEDEVPILDECSNVSPTRLDNSNSDIEAVPQSTLRRKYSLRSLISCSQSSVDEEEQLIAPDSRRISGIEMGNTDDEEEYVRQITNNPRKSQEGQDLEEDDDASSNERRAKHVDLRGQVNRNISESYLLWSAYQRHLTKYKCDKYAAAVQRKDFWIRYFPQQIAKFDCIQEGFSPSLIIMKKNFKHSSQYARQDARDSSGFGCRRRLKDMDNTSMDSTNRDLTAKTTVSLKLNQSIDILLTPLFVECMTRYVNVLTPELGQSFTSTVINRLHFQSVQLTLDRLKPTKGLQKDDLTSDLQSDETDSTAHVPPPPAPPPPAPPPPPPLINTVGGSTNAASSPGTVCGSINPNNNQKHGSTTIINLEDSVESKEMCSKSWVHRTVSSVLNPSITSNEPVKQQLTPSGHVNNSLSHHTVINLSHDENDGSNNYDKYDDNDSDDDDDNNYTEPIISQTLSSPIATDHVDALTDQDLDSAGLMGSVLTEPTRISRTQLSVSIDRVNVCIMQLYVIEDIVNADTLVTGLHDLTCVSLMSLCLDSACFQILINTRNDSEQLEYDTFQRAHKSRKHSTSKVTGNEYPSHHVGGLFNHELDRFRKTEDMIANIEVKRIHGQLRRLTRESQFSPNVLLTAIPFNSSKVFFAFESDPGGALSKSVKLDERSAGWIMFECGLENLTLKGIRKRGYPDKMDDYSKKSNPFQNPRQPHESTDNQPPDSNSTGRSNPGLNEINEVFEEATEEAIDRLNRNALISQLKVKTVWLNFPAPKKLPNKRRVDITRDDWNLLSTATPAIRAWMEPCHRVIYACNKLKQATERRQLAVLACLMTDISFGKFTNKLISSSVNSYDTWRTKLARDIYREPTCQAFTVMRMFLQSSSPQGSKVQEVERSLKEDTLPQLDILQRGIFALTRHFQHVIILDPPNILPNPSTVGPTTQVPPMTNTVPATSMSHSNDGIDPDSIHSLRLTTQAVDNPIYTNHVLSDINQSPLMSGEALLISPTSQESRPIDIAEIQRPIIENYPQNIAEISPIYQSEDSEVHTSQAVMMERFLRDAKAATSTNNENRQSVSYTEQNAQNIDLEANNMSVGLDGNTITDEAIRNRQAYHSNTSYATSQLNQANFLRMHYNYIEDAKRNFKPLLEIAGLHVKGIRRTTLMKKFGGFFSASGLLETFKIDIIQSESNPLSQYNVNQSYQVSQSTNSAADSTNNGTDVLCSLPDQRKFGLKRSPSHRSSTFRCQGFSLKIVMRDVIGFESTTNIKNDFLIDSDIRPTTTQVYTCVSITEIRQHIHMPLLRLVHQFVTMVYCAHDTQEEINNRRCTEWSGFSKRHQKHYSKGSSNDTVITGETVGGNSSSLGNRSQQDMLHYSSLKSSTSASKMEQEQQMDPNATDVPECWKRMYIILDFNSRVPEMKTITTGAVAQSRRSFALPHNIQISLPLLSSSSVPVNINNQLMPTIKEELNESSSALCSPLINAANYNNQQLHPQIQFIDSAANNNYRVHYHKRQSSVTSSNFVSSSAERTKLEIEKFTYPWMRSERIPLVVFCVGKVKKMSLSAVLSELNLDGQLHNLHCSFTQTSRVKGRGMFADKTCDQSFSLHSGELVTTLIEEMDSKKLDVVKMKGKPCHIMFSAHKTRKLEKNTCFFSLGLFDVVLPHHPKKLKDVVERNAKRISSTMTEFLRPYHNLQQLYDGTNSSGITGPNMDRGSESYHQNLEGINPAGTISGGLGTSVGVGGNILGVSLDNMPNTNTVNGLTNNISSNIDIGKDVVDSGRRTDNIVNKNKLESKKPMVLTITGLSKGLTVSVALYHSTTAQYNLDPVYMSGSLFEDDFKVNISIKNHSLSFLSLQPLPNVPPKMRIVLPKIVMQICKRVSKGGKFLINQGHITQDLMTEKGNYIDVLASVSTLEHSVPIELLSYVLVTVQLFINEINEVIQKMSGEVGAINGTLPTTSNVPPVGVTEMNECNKSISYDNKLWNRAARGNTKFSFRVTMEGIKLTTTTRYGEVKFETEQIEVEFSNRVRSCNSLTQNKPKSNPSTAASGMGNKNPKSSGFNNSKLGFKEKSRNDSTDANMTQYNADLQETIFVFMLIKKISVELGVTQKDALYDEKPPEFRSLAFFTTTISLRSLLTEEMLNRHATDIKLVETNREDYLIHLLHPIIWARPIAINRAAHIWKLFNTEFNECRRVLVPEAGSQQDSSTAATPNSATGIFMSSSSGMGCNYATNNSNNPATNSNVIFLQLFIEELGACMPIQTPLSDGQDPRVHLVLTLEQAQLTSCFKQGLVCQGEFHNFCLRFDEAFNVGGDDWKPDTNVNNENMHRPSIVFNGCVVPNGTYKLKSKLPSLENDRILVELDWSMCGFNTHLDWFIGRRLRELLSVVSGMITATPESYCDQQEMSLNRTTKFFTDSSEELVSLRKPHTNTSRTSVSTAPVDKILGYTSPQPSRKRKKQLSHAPFSTPPADSSGRPTTLNLPLSLLNNKSVTIPLHTRRADSEYFDADQNSSSSDIYPEQFEDCIEEITPPASPTIHKSHLPKTNTNNSNSGTTTAGTTGATNQTATSLAIDLKVNIKVASGNCVLHPKLVAGNGSGSNVPTSRNSCTRLNHNVTMAAIETDEDRHAQLRNRYYTYLQLPSMNSDISMFYIPAVDLNLLYTSKDNNNTSTSSNNSTTHKHKSDLYAFVLLKKLPKDLVMCPSLIDFVEQALEMDLEQDMRIWDEEDIDVVMNDETSNAKRTSVSSDTTSKSSTCSMIVPESLPVDVTVHINVEPSTLRILSVSNATTVTCMMGLPSVNLVFASNRNNNTNTNVHEGGLSMTGTLHKFTIEVFRSHGSAVALSSTTTSNRWNPRPTEVALHLAVEKIQVNLCRLHELTVCQDPILSCNNNVKISAIAYIGTAQFRFDTRCIGDLTTFCTAWYRPSLARRLLLGNDPGMNLEDQPLSEQPDVPESNTYTIPTTQFSSKSTSMRSSWCSLLTVAISLDELDVQMAMSNICKAQLQLGQTQATGHMGLDSNGRRDVQWRIGVQRSRLSGLEGGMIGGEGNLESLDLCLLRGDNSGGSTDVPNGVGSNSASANKYLMCLSLRHCDMRLEYMGTSVLLGRLCGIDLRARNEVQSQLGAQLDWEQCQLAIGRNTLQDVTKMRDRVKSHLEDLWHSHARSPWITNANSTTNGRPTTAEAAREEKEQKSYFTRVFERHWQPVFKILMDTDISNSLSAGGNLRICGAGLGLVFFSGSLRSSMEWAVLCVQSLDIGIETMVGMENSTQPDSINIHQTANLVLGRKQSSSNSSANHHHQQLQTLPHCAFLIRANASREPNPRLSPRTNEWLDYAFRPADTSIMAFLQQGHNSSSSISLYSRLTSFPDSASHCTVRQNPLNSFPASGSILLALPALDLVFHSTHRQTLETPISVEQAIDRLVETSLIADFHSFISCGISEVTWLPNLVSTYMKQSSHSAGLAGAVATASAAAESLNDGLSSLNQPNIPGANILISPTASTTTHVSNSSTVASNNNTSTQQPTNTGVNEQSKEPMTSVPHPDSNDQRIFRTKEFKVGPNLRILQANHLSVPPADKFLQLLGIYKGKTSVPKYLQRGLIDPLDSLLSKSVLAILKMKQDSNEDDKIVKKHKESGPI